MGGPIKIGSVTIDTLGQLKVGSSNVQQAYVGSVLVFPATTTTTTSTTSTTSTTTSTTTIAPTTTSTTTSTTTIAPTTTSTTTSTTTLPYNSFSLAYSSLDGPEACSRYPTLFTNTYYTDPNFSVLSNGVIIYQDTGLTNAAGNGFYSNGANYWNTGAGSGNLQNQTVCPGSTTTTTSTTTIAPTTTSTTTSTTTIAPTTTSTTTSTTTVAGTCHNYQIEGAPSIDVEWYECDGTPNSATVSGAFPLICAQTGTVTQTGGAGNIVQLSTCTSPTTTTTSTTTTTTTEAPTTTTSTTTTTTTEQQVRVDWGVSEQGSGAVQLIIKDSEGTERVNAESQGTGPITGTIYIAQNKTPYTATITRTGGAEVAQFRICNVSTNSEITLNTNVTTATDYIVLSGTATPLWSSVYATYGNSNTPPTCIVE